MGAVDIKRTLLVLLAMVVAALLVTLACGIRGAGDSSEFAPRVAVLATTMMLLGSALAMSSHAKRPVPRLPIVVGSCFLLPASLYLIVTGSLSLAH